MFHGNVFLMSDSTPQVADVSLNQEHIDSDFASDICEMAEKFAEEIDNLKKAMCDVFGDWEGMGGGQMEVKQLGKLADLNRIHEEVAEVQNKVKNTTKQFRVS